MRIFFFKIGIDILSRALDQVPSALVGLTSLFGMGRGDPHRNRRHKGIKGIEYRVLRYETQRLNTLYSILTTVNTIKQY